MKLEQLGDPDFDYPGHEENKDIAVWVVRAEDLPDDARYLRPTRIKGIWLVFAVQEAEEQNGHKNNGRYAKFAAETPVA